MCCGRRRAEHDLAALLTLVAFVLVTAAYIPANGIKARTKDPMSLGVKCWALGHLCSNGTLADVVLFGRLPGLGVLWPRRAPTPARGRRTAIAAPRRGRTAITLVVGVLAWMLFALHLHQPLIGVGTVPRGSN